MTRCRIDRFRGMSLLLRVPRKRKEKPVSFLQVELVSNKVAKKHPFSNEENGSCASTNRKVKKRLFTHVCTVESSASLDVEPNEEFWTSNKKRTSNWEKAKQESNTTGEWKVLNLIDNFQETNSSLFTLNDDILVKEYVGEITVDPFTPNTTEEFVYDLYKISDGSSIPAQESGLSIRVLSESVVEDWLVPEEDDNYNDSFSSDSNRTYDYPETPETSIEYDSEEPEISFHTEEDQEEYGSEEGNDTALWRTKDLLRKLQRTSIYDSSSSSYNSEDSAIDSSF